MSYRISNSHGYTGPAWSATYPSLEAAAEHLRRAMQWDAIVLSGAFTDLDENGEATTARCAYETEEDRGDDPDGSRAPWITAVEDEDQITE